MPVEQSHILIIDDNEDILSMLKIMLELEGYRISIKENAIEIITFIGEISPDVILMDMLLSGADGREICKQLKAVSLFSKIPVIMISAHSEAKIECMEAGAEYFLEKPFDMNELFNTINEALS